jgi:excisionase family DNA binding protein
MSEFDRGRVLSLVEVGKRLGVHPESVNRWVRAGELKATRLGRGGKLWITPTDLRAFLKGGGPARHATHDAVEAEPVRRD